MIEHLFAASCMSPVHLLCWGCESAHAKLTLCAMASRISLMVLGCRQTVRTYCCICWQSGEELSSSCCGCISSPVCGCHTGSSNMLSLSIIRVECCWQCARTSNVVLARQLVHHGACCDSHDWFVAHQWLMCCCESPTWCPVGPDNYFT